jgi:hypothetical protein
MANFLLIDIIAFVTLIIYRDYQKNKIALFKYYFPLLIKLINGIVIVTAQYLLYYLKSV